MNHGWMPNEEMRRLRRQMARLMSQFAPEFMSGAEALSVPVDLYEESGEYVLMASLPGLKRDEINLRTDAGVLTIGAEIPEHPDGRKFLLQERPSGAMSRSVKLPDSVDEERIVSSFREGVLTVHLPKLTEVTGRTIHIDVGAE